MSKKVIIDAFFNQFNSFLEELRQMYPEDSDFPVFITTLSMMKTMNPMLVINFVKDEILPHSARIEAKDENFLRDYKYEAYEGVDLNIVEKLKEYNANSSPATKETIWNYFNIIIKLCRLATE